MTQVQTQPKRQVDTIVLAMRAKAAREQLLETVALLDQRTKHAMHQVVRASTASSALVAALATTWLGISAWRSTPDNLRETRNIRSSSSRLGTPSMPRLVRGAAFAVGVLATGLLLRSLLRQPTTAESHAISRGKAVRSQSGVYRL